MTFAVSPYFSKAPISLAIQTPVPAAPMDEKPNEILLGSAARAWEFDHCTNKRIKSTLVKCCIANLLGSARLSRLLAKLGAGTPAKLAGHLEIEARRLRDILFGNMRSVQLIHLCAVGLSPYVGPALDRRDAVAAKRVGVVGGVALAARERRR